MMQEDEMKSERECDGRVCPKTGRRLPRDDKRKWAIWLLPFIGLFSAIWFLLRVIPKPSRAAYPCQKVAAPLASSFVIWILGLAASAVAYHKGKTHLLQSRTWKAAACAGVLMVASVVVVTNLPKTPLKAADNPPHNVLGEGQGIYPGRVVWVHDPNATNWGGFNSAQRWYDNTYTDPVVVERMFSQAIQGIAGTNNDLDAWDKIFRYFNVKHGNGNTGYYPGEKIMIKLNMVTCNGSGAIDPVTFDKYNSIKNNVDVTPQMVRALLKQLVYNVGVNQSDISVGDTTAYWPRCYLDQLRSEFPSVHYIQHVVGPNRTLAVPSTTKINFSTSAANGKLQDYLPTCYAEADYFINFAVLKGHSSGITLCGKNNYGSLIRYPDPGTQNYYDMHLSLPNPGWSPGLGHYRAMVDLMGHPKLGGNTLLYLVDGLYGGYYWDAHPYKWASTPFGIDWPSSLFASLDPVAIDSVGYDFLLREWPTVVKYGTNSGPPGLQGGAEDYLHEAALANNPPSGAFYDPDRDGVQMQSLGTHEHWNNDIDKMYSRNLGLGKGIGLVKLNAQSGSFESPVDLADFTNDAGTPIQVKLTLKGVVTSRFEELGADGKLQILGLAPGKYDINIKASHWLAKNVKGFNITALGYYAMTDSLTMVNGDVNGNNMIDINDYNAVTRALGSTPGSQYWNPSADLDGNGVVNITDRRIVQTNMGRKGDR